MKSSLFALVGLTLSFVADAAHAQSCTEDSDCAPEDYCDLYPSSGESSGDSAPACEPGQDCIDARDEASAAEQAEPDQPQAPRGECERGGRDCTQDSDCLADHYCSLDDVDVATCPADQDCSEIVPPEPTGQCEHDPYECNADADCPEPAVCGDDGECILRLEPCMTDGACSARYECLSVRGGGSSSDDSEPQPASADPKPVSEGSLMPSSASSGAEISPDDPLPAPTSDEPSSDEPTSGAPEPDPDPTQPSADDAAEGTTTQAEDTASEDDASVEGICFPAPAPCETDGDCADGWICAELEDAPPGWDDIERTCLPPGIAAALDGTLEVEGGGRGESGSSNTSADAEHPSDGAAEPDEDSDRTDSSESVLGTQGGSEGSSGCAVLASGSHAHAPRWALALLGLALALRRRGRPASLSP